jgi:hypothetical protein
VGGWVVQPREKDKVWVNEEEGEFSEEEDSRMRVAFVWLVSVDGGCFFFFFLVLTTLRTSCFIRTPLRALVQSENDRGRE